MEGILCGISYTLLSISILFLLSSLCIFIMSGKGFFSIDINVLHFNHAFSLLVAMSCFVFIEIAKYENLYCKIVAFLLHFLWTNVFLSSLAIGIVVFYSICVVSIKHTAIKLSKFLVPIIWCFSFLWCLVWLIIGISNQSYIDTKNTQPEAGKRCNNFNISETNNNNNTNNSQTWTCFISKDNGLIWSFIISLFLILLIKTLLLVISLCKIRSALKKRDNSEGDLRILRKVTFGGVSLIPALSLYFIFSLPLAFSPLYKDNKSLYTAFEFLTFYLLLQLVYSISY